MRPTEVEGLALFPRTLICNIPNHRTLPVQKAFKTNILEDDGDEIDIFISQQERKMSSMNIVIRPFEVVTLRLEL